MKKTHLPISETRTDSAEIAARLFRLISDVVRHLDDQRARAESARELFSQNWEVQRVKLRDYCDKLMFTDPVNYGRKAEELLWRKGYYDVVSTVKRLNKMSTFDPIDLALIESHLQSGIGHYHHLIMKLQSHFRLDLRGIVDFPLLVTERGLKKDKNIWSSKAIESGALEWAHSAIHRCLIYLGDLSRYISDFNDSNDNGLAVRYYSQALNWKPEVGTPHNQLGTLKSKKSFGLDAAYHYMRSICCVQKFEGSEWNLQSLLEGNSRALEELKKSKEPTCQLQQLILNFIQIAACLFNEKPFPSFSLLCNGTMGVLNNCLTEMDSQLISTTTDTKPRLTDDDLFKMVVISIMCVERLKTKGSQHTMGGVALGLALVSQVIQCAVNRLEIVLQPRQPPAAKNGLKQCRRRRRRRSYTVTSDLSDDESDSEDTGEDSNRSEENLVFDQNDSDEENIPNGNGIEKTNGFIQSDDEDLVVAEGKFIPWENPMITENKTFQHVQKICESGYIMQSIKVCCDWLLDNLALVKSCGASCGLLISRLVSLFNHLVTVKTSKAIQETSDSSITEEVVFSISLPEDINIRGLNGFHVAHSKLNWDYLRTRILSPKQETFVRIHKLVGIGLQLSQSSSVGLKYSEVYFWFSASIPEKNGHKPREKKQEKIPSKTRNARNEKLMQEMGQLWLKAEVDELENKTRKVQTHHLPPYLVMDSEAFIHFSYHVKQLVAAKKFILVIPTSVISALDEQKRSSGRVRDTIRWIETHLRNGNRFLRAQRPNEHLPLPLIKYPKKKDKEALMFFQIVECCHFLSQQSTGDKDSELVTLITGSKTLLSNNQNGFSPLGVAKSAGINVEHIEAFFSKWKSSTKSHG